MAKVTRRQFQQQEQMQMQMAWTLEKQFSSELETTDLPQTSINATATENDC